MKSKKAKTEKFDFVSLLLSNLSKMKTVGSLKSISGYVLVSGSKTKKFLGPNGLTPKLADSLVFPKQEKAEEVKTITKKAMRATFKVVPLDQIAAYSYRIKYSPKIALAKHIFFKENVESLSDLVKAEYEDVRISFEDAQREVLSAFARHQRALESRCSRAGVRLSDLSQYPRARQALLHWSWDSTLRWRLSK